MKVTNAIPYLTSFDALFFVLLIETYYFQFHGFHFYINGLSTLNKQSTHINKLQYSVAIAYIVISVVNHT